MARVRLGLCLVLGLVMVRVIRVSGARVSVS